MYSHKILLLLLALTAITACQTKSVGYEVATVVLPMQPYDEHGKPTQYAVDITVTESGPNGENILMKPRLLTIVGSQAEINGGEILCTATVKNENGGTRVDTSVGITKEGKEVYLFKQSTTLPL